MNILYLTFGETPSKTGVYQSQVLDLISSFENQTEHSLTLCSFVPLVNSGFVKMRTKYFEEIRRIKGDLKNKYTIHWMLAPQNLIYSSGWLFYFFHLFTLKRLCKLIEVNDIDIIHCRSYHAAYAAVKVRAKFGLKVKIIFDPRGNFPEEICIKKGLDVKSKGYRFYKKIEENILSNVDSIVCLSKPMQKYFNSIIPGKCELIYANARLPSRPVGKPNLVSDNEVKRLCYVGAIPESGWHKSTSLCDLYMAFRKSFPSTELVFITRTNKKDILKFFPEDIHLELVFYSVNSSEEVYDILSGMDFGALPFCKPSSEPERLVGDTMVGTKTLEYIACDIPVLANSLCGGASDIINEYNLGIVYDNEKIDSSINENELLNFNKSFSGNIRNGYSICSDKFSLEANCLKYSGLYSKV